MPSRSLSLRADCDRCFALCCVAPAFSVSADFAINKSAGEPCPNLTPGLRCGVHDRLRPMGFTGCAVFDCFGAGQKVSQVTFGGQGWRRNPGVAASMFAVLPIMRQLHEVLWHVAEALTLRAAQPIHPELERAFQAIERLTYAGAEALLEVDVAARRHEVNALLLRASELARAGYPDRRDFSGSDLIGRRFAGADLRGASLRGAYLIGADLTGADLRSADFTGADLRGADLGGADLTGSLFLTQSQLDAAKGDVHTTLAPPLVRPAHWPAAVTSS